MTATTEVRWIYEDERLVMGRAGTLLLLGWREAPLLDHVRRWHELGRTIAREHPGQGACIDVVYGGTPSFGEDMRKAAVAMAADPDFCPLGIAHPIVVPGMVGTAVRAFVSTVILVSRAPAPAKVTPDLRTAVRWLAPRVAHLGWTETSLDEVCRALEARSARR